MTSVAIRCKIVAHVGRVVGERVGRRDIGRADVGAGCTARNRLGWRRHHVSKTIARLHEASLDGGDSGLVGSGMLAFASP